MPACILLKLPIGLELVQFTFSFVLYLYRDIIDNVKYEIIKSSGLRFVWSC